MYIYKIINHSNNKIYIGQSINPIQKRFNRHINDAINNVIDTHLARAIRKYGKENFTIDMIDKAESQEELNKKEQYWIRKLNSTNPSIGYNETDALYKCGGNTYQSKTKEEMNIISNKIRKTKIGKNNPASKQIKCKNINTGQEIIFDSMSECKQYFKEKHHRFITTRVTKQVKSPYKNQWVFAYVDDEYTYINNYTRKGNIVIANINGKEIQYNSIREFCRCNNINRGKLKKVIDDNKSIIDNIKFTILN